MYLMFKSLLAASAIALATAMPSFAAPSTCWIGANARSNGSIPAQSCDVHHRVNANGHRVIDVYTPVDGVTMTVILWKDENHNPEYAELIGSNGTRVTMNYRFDNSGDLHLFNDAAEAYIRL